MVSPFIFAAEAGRCYFGLRDFAKVDASVTQAGLRGNGFVRFVAPSAYL